MLQFLPGIVSISGAGVKIHTRHCLYISSAPARAMLDAGKKKKGEKDGEGEGKRERRRSVASSVSSAQGGGSSGSEDEDSAAAAARRRCVRACLCRIFIRGMMWLVGDRPSTFYPP